MFNDLETPVNELPARASKQERPTFPCMKCSGTGVYTFGYINIQQGKCHACNGRGHFMTSPQQRQKTRAASATRKENKADSNFEAFREQEQSAAEWIESRAERSDFARSLRDGVRKYGSLTEKQLAAVYNCIAKDAERDAQRAAANKPAAVVDLSAVFEKFATARESGLKRLKLRVPGFVFTPAKGKNEGHLYIKDGPQWEDTYLGKVAPGGEFFKSRDCSDEQVAELQAIASDVLAAAKTYGQQTGSCSCCGRELTNAESIELGIGPICLSKWGL